MDRAPALWSEPHEPGPLEVAVEAALAALAERPDAQPLGPVHVAAVRALAAAIDRDCRRSVTAYTLARSTRQLVEFLEAMAINSTPEPEADPDEFDALVTSLSAPSRNVS